MSERKPLEGLAECIEKSTAARGVDYYATEIYRIDIGEWAEMTDRDRSTVAQNIRKAHEDIDIEA